MANKGRARVSNTVSRNPIYRRAARPSRPKVMFDGTTLQTTDFTGLPAVDASALAADHYKTDCANLNSMAASMAAVTGLYSTYKYLNSAVHFEPSIGPASTEAGSRIHVAYVDNPEKLNNWIAATTANKLLQIRGLKNMRTFNAWERFSYSIPLTYRRKLFDVNQSVVADVDTFDRSCQGALLIVVEGVTALSSSYGVFRKQSTIELHGLNRVTTS